jgi:hypothetical protein
MRWKDCNDSLHFYLLGKQKTIERGKILIAIGQENKLSLMFFTSTVDKDCFNAQLLPFHVQKYSHFAEKELTSWGRCIK